MSSEMVAVTQADKDAVTAFHNGQVARIIAGDRTLGENRDAIEQAFARHRLAERERCAKYLEDRAAEILAVSTNHTTGVMMSGIFRGEAAAIRENAHVE